MITSRFSLLPSESEIIIRKFSLLSVHALIMLMINNKCSRFLRDSSSPPRHTQTICPFTIPFLYFHGVLSIGTKLIIPISLLNKNKILEKKI